MPVFVTKIFYDFLMIILPIISLIFTPISTSNTPPYANQFQTNSPSDTAVIEDIEISSNASIVAIDPYDFTKKSSTDQPVKETTEPTTEMPTEPKTEETIEPTTEPITEKPTQPPKKKINSDNFNYHYSYNYLNSQQQSVVKEVFNYLEGKEYQQHIVIEPGLSWEERREIYTYLTLYFSDFEGNYNILDGYCGDNYTEFYLCENNITRLFNQKQELDNDIDNVLVTFDDGSNVEIANQIAKYISNKADYCIDKTDSHHVLWENQGNCNGFALLFHTMCHRVGIKCDLITGYANGEYHTWNRIKLEDGSYRYYDLSFYEYSADEQYLAAYSSPWNIIGVNRYLY